jgi:PIN domain nuclease of toxin-antitoxin system
MSTVNLSEVLGRFSRQGHSAAAVLARLEQTRLRWSSFDAAQALIAAELLPLTRSLGLSLGDRACLALALSRNIPVMTADRAWEKLRLDVEIAIIR